MDGFTLMLIQFDSKLDFKKKKKKHQSYQVGSILSFFIIIHSSVLLTYNPFKKCKKRNLKCMLDGMWFLGNICLNEIKWWGFGVCRMAQGSKLMN